jgi:hypothetical protein
MKESSSLKQLSKVLPGWFLGIREGQELDLTPKNRIAIFVAFSIVFFIFSWFLFDAIRPVYYGALAESTDLLCSILDKGLDFSVRDGLILFQSFRVPFFEADLSPVGVVANTALLWTLILATPGMSLKNRAIALGIGNLLLMLSQTIFLLTKVEAGLISANHPSAGNEVIWRFLDDFLEITGKGFFPVLIWIGFCLKYMLGKVDKQTDRVPVARNAPCPCGSGKKYKRCCGK